jgi:hypothetical protein
MSVPAGSTVLNRFPEPGPHLQRNCAQLQYGRSQVHLRLARPFFKAHR